MRRLLAGFTAMCLVAGPAIAAEEQGQNVFAPLLQSYDLIKGHALYPVPDERLVQGALQGMLAAAGMPNKLEYHRRLRGEEVWMPFLVAYDDVTAAKGHKPGPELIRAAIRGMLKELDDPLCRLTSAQDGPRVGVGLALAKQDEALVVTGTVEGGPADGSGIKPGDRLVAIDGHPTTALRPVEASQSLLGPTGSEVTLTLQRGEASKTLTLKRTRPTMPAVRTEELGPGVRYLKLRHFNERGIVKEIRYLLGEAPHDVWVLDLRGCAGGLLPAAVEIGSLFIAQGPIVRIAGREREEQTLTVSGQTAIPPSTPVVVLVDGSTASGGEILAGAFQDSGRAQVLGTRTMGLGTIQSVYELKDDAKSQLALTTHRFLTPGGREIDRVGIQPAMLQLDPADGPDPLLKAVLRELQEALKAQGHGPMPPKFYEKRTFFE